MYPGSSSSEQQRETAVALFEARYGEKVIAANVLDASSPHRPPDTKWATDVTEFRVGDHKVSLFPVIDLFDRSVIAYSHGRIPGSGPQAPTFT
ncbi:hypothetical protein AB0M80_02700 [Amycolatopsis sp. NPDC051045]|uniref:hypothetical protein n=1 Tax=Amycolatopsis sp. NPDC051045 TaxID=3156922 RepID=UPI00344370A8